MILAMAASLLIQSPDPTLPTRLSEYGIVVGQAIQCRAFEYTVDMAEAERTTERIRDGNQYITASHARSIVLTRAQHETDSAMRAIDALDSREAAETNITAVVERCDSLAAQHPALVSRTSGTDAAISEARAFAAERFPE